MNSKLKKIILFVLVVGIAVFFRFYQIKNVPPGLYPDEAMNGNNALETLANKEFSARGGSAFGGKVFYPENNGREGLFINIQALFLKFLIPEGGVPEPWMLRIVSAIFGTLTVLGIYFLTKELFRNSDLGFRNSYGEKIALLSSFFLAVSFWHINFSRIGFRAIMAPFFLTWGIYFLLLALKKVKNYSLPTTHYLLLSLLAGAVYGLGFHSYIAYRATPLLILIIFFWLWLMNKEKIVRKKILFSAFYFLISTLIVVSPLFVYFAKNPADFFGRTTQISVFNSESPLKDLGLNILKTAGMFNVSGDYNWRHNFSGRPLLFWPVGILFIIGFILSLKNFKKCFILPIWLIIAALPVVVSNESVPHALRAILMAPPVFILTGAGGAWFFNKVKKLTEFFNFKFSFYILIFAFFIWTIINSYTAYFIKWGKNQNTKNAFAENYAELAREINSWPKEMPKYIVVEAGGISVRGLPMAAQTVMFLTDSFTPEKQSQKNIHYILPEESKGMDLSSNKVFVIK